MKEKIKNPKNGKCYGMYYIKTIKRTLRKKKKKKL